jgi:hypothetical protein
MKNTLAILERLRVSVSFRAVFCVREHVGHFEHLLHESKNKEIIISSSVCFLRTSYNLLNVGSTYLRCDHEVEIRIAVTFLRKALRVYTHTNYFIYFHVHKLPFKTGNGSLKRYSV